MAEGHSPLEQFDIKTIVPIHIGGIDASFTNASLVMVVTAVIITVFMLAAPFFAQSTDLIVPVPERVAHIYADSLNLVVHEPPPEVDLGNFDYVQVWHERRDDDPVHRWLRQLVRNAARNIHSA